MLIRSGLVITTVSEHPQPPPSVLCSADAGTVPTRHNWSKIFPSIAVIETVAVATNQKSTMPALHEAIDPESLDAICTQETDVQEDEAIRISFSHAGREVTVLSDGDVLVAPQGDAA